MGEVRRKLERELSGDYKRKQKRENSDKDMKEKRGEKQEGSGEDCELWRRSRCC